MNPLSILSGDPDTFVREVWGRRILVHHVEPGLLEGIFGIDQADHLITETAMRHPDRVRSLVVRDESRPVRAERDAGGGPRPGIGALLAHHVAYEPRAHVAEEFTRRDARAVG